MSWPSAVRRLARERLGPVGEVIRQADKALLVIGIALIPIALVVMATFISTPLTSQ